VPPADAPANETPGPLSGFTLVLTSDRRSQELSASFERRGAKVLHSPTLRIVPLVEDELLLAATKHVLDQPPTDVIVTTAIGLRGWIEAADAAGQAPELLQALAGARLLARGPKARGAIRVAGLVEEWAAESEKTDEIVDWLLEEGVTGRRIAFQLHGVVNDDQVTRLRDAGAAVEAVPVYRWGPAPNPSAVIRGIDAICSRACDAVVFTSAPGAQALLDAAHAVDRLDELLDALAKDVVAAAVGEVTAGPLRKLGVSPLVPDRARLGALVRCLADHLETLCVGGLSTAHGRLTVRGRSAVLDGQVFVMSPAPLAVLRELVRANGEIVDRQTLLAALPGATGEHAIEVAVARLRTSLGAPKIVETVVKRGYRVAVSPAGDVRAGTNGTGETGCLTY
jgi:uroporphyrinogen-III synthase